MGLSCVSMHFHAADDKALSEALNRRGVDRYHIAPAKQGWTSLYEQQASEQNDQRIRDLTGGLPDVLLRYCRSGVRQDDLAAVLAEEPLFAEHTIERIADALGIDVQRALADYRHVGGGDGGDGTDDGFDGGDDDDDGPRGGLGQLFPGGAPKIALTPLLAAVVHKQPRAAEQLLDGGADPNHVHPLFGTPVHVATGAGAAELLQLLLDRGGDVHGHNAQGQTPRQVLAAGRQTRERLAQVQSLMTSMGMKSPLPAEQLLSNLTLPTEGWDACERLLKSRGA